MEPSKKKARVSQKTKTKASAKSKSKNILPEDSEVIMGAYEKYKRNWSLITNDPAIKKLDLTKAQMQAHVSYKKKRARRTEKTEEQVLGLAEQILAEAQQTEEENEERRRRKRTRRRRRGGGRRRRRDGRERVGTKGCPSTSCQRTNTVARRGDELANNSNHYDDEDDEGNDGWKYRR
jgi:hypothetical protein